LRVRIPDVPTARAAWWTLRSARRVERSLARNGLQEPRLPRVPHLPAKSDRGVAAVLRRTDSTCLVSALVRQRWLAARGDCRDVIIGVTAPSTGFQAHAWLEGEQEDDEVFAQLLRWAPGVGVVDTNPRAGVGAGAAEN
jgi:hypothetical protein